MTETRLHIEATLEEVWLDLDEVCRLTRLPADWVRAHVSGGLLMVAFGAGDDEVARLRQLALRPASA